MKLKYVFAAALLAVMLTGCKVWEEKWEEVIPLPETEIPVDPQPWEPVDGGEEVGN